MSEDDCTSAQELAMSSLKNLYEKNSTHELLGPFLQGGLDGNDEEFDRVWEEFQVRFGKPGLTKEQRGNALGQAHFWANWHLAVEETLKTM